MAPVRYRDRSFSHFFLSVAVSLSHSFSLENSLTRRPHTSRPLQRGANGREIRSRFCPGRPPARANERSHCVFYFPLFFFSAPAYYYYYVCDTRYSIPHPVTEPYLFFIFSLLRKHTTQTYIIYNYIIRTYYIYTININCTCTVL